MIRAAIYARYSSDAQRAASIEDQVRLCRERIEREGWSLAQTCADRAASGGSLLRPGIQALTEDAMTAGFEVVVAKALDRISRDQADVAGFYKRMKFAGIRVVTRAEGEVSDLRRRALLWLRSSGRARRRRPADRDGRRINEEGATVVLRIFEAYRTERSPRAIAIALNREKVAGPNSGSWGPSTINGKAARGTGILNTELYAGRLVWNRLRYIKDPDTGKRVSRLNPPGAWTTREVPELRIVSPVLWDAVKCRQGTAKGGTICEGMRSC